MSRPLDVHGRPMRSVEEEVWLEVYLAVLRLQTGARYAAGQADQALRLYRVRFPEPAGGEQPTAPEPDDALRLDEALLEFIHEWNGIAIYPSSADPNQVRIAASAQRLVARGLLSARQDGEAVLVAPVPKEVRT